MDAEQAVIVWNCDPSCENEKLDFNFGNDAQTTNSVGLSTNNCVSSNQEDVPKDRSSNLLVEYSSSDSDGDN